ncbi:MAG: 50S ribosomal protein L29 [Candidatus Omnitrophica bacterium]|nr:50S ribosomal protein L29 [Candidatus Omnitrophota bacterium]
MKPAEIRNMTKAEVENKLIALREQLFKMRAEIATGRVERPGKFRLIKRDIAKCCTILKEKESEA